MRHTARPYEPDSDLPRLTAFLVSVRPAHRLADYPGPTDLHEILALPSNQARACLWLDERGELMGFGIVDHSDNLLFEAALGVDEEDIWRSILEWAEGAIRVGRAPTDGCTLDTCCRSEDVRRIRILVEKGFSPTGISTVTLVRSLQSEIPRPGLPAGWAIRAVQGEQEVEALVSLHRAAFGTENLSVAERLSWMRAPHYVPALDLVVVTDAGELAGYCMCGIKREANEITGQRRGYTDPVAVHRHHQGRGVARALLARGMTLLAQQGMTEAVMNTSSENDRMLRVAQSLGYEVEAVRAWYSKRMI